MWANDASDLQRIISLSRRLRRIRRKQPSRIRSQVGMCFTSRDVAKLPNAAFLPV
jgi:hypothetical protein